MFVVSEHDLDPPIAERACHLPDYLHGRFEKRGVVEFIHPDLHALLRDDLRVHETRIATHARRGSVDAKRGDSRTG